jgi:hypothetical protein
VRKGIHMPSQYIGLPEVSEATMALNQRMPTYFLSANILLTVPAVALTDIDKAASVGRVLLECILCEVR